MDKYSISNRILFTGGGSAGHVVPCIPLIEHFKEAKWEVFYIGRKTGIERDLILPLQIKYFSIPSGKLRRYFSFKNFVDIFRVLSGILKSFFLLCRLKPQIIFSKGGFVSVPVVLSAWILRVPVFIHESDVTMGLANRLVCPFVSKICITFQETQKQLNNFKNKVVITGSPIRDMIFNGKKTEGEKIVNFKQDKINLLVIGGGNGSKFLNDYIRMNLDRLLTNYNIIHICGKGRLDNNLHQTLGYRQFEFVEKELPHLLALSDIVISRAGANIICELISLKKPHILIPLSKRVSRGEQIANAYLCAKVFGSRVIEEERLHNTFFNILSEVSANLKEIQAKLSGIQLSNGKLEIIQLLINSILNGAT